MKTTTPTKLTNNINNNTFINTSTETNEICDVLGDEDSTKITSIFNNNSNNNDRDNQLDANDNNNQQQEQQQEHQHQHQQHQLDLFQQNMTESQEQLESSPSLPPAFSLSQHPSRTTTSQSTILSNNIPLFSTSNSNDNNHCNGNINSNNTDSVDFYELPEPRESEDFRFESIGTSEEHGTPQRQDSTHRNSEDDHPVARYRFDFSILRAFRKFALSALTALREDDVNDDHDTGINSRRNSNAQQPHQQPQSQQHENRDDDSDGEENDENQPHSPKTNKIQYHQRQQNRNRKKPTSSTPSRLQRQSQLTQQENDEANRVTPSAQVLRSDNMEAFVIPRVKETALVNKIRDISLTADNDYVGISDSFWLRASLRARNGDVLRAIALCGNYLKWRRNAEYHTRIHNGLPPKVFELLSSGTFTVIGNKSKSEQPVLTIRYEYYEPSKYEVEDACLTFCLVVEYLMREYPKCQTHGMIIMEEMSRAKTSNLDLRLARFLTRAMSSIIPLRISAMFFCNAKRGVRTALRFMSPLLARKFKTNVYVMHEGLADRFAAFFDHDETPTFMRMHGTLIWTHEDQKNLAAIIAEKCQTWPKASTFKNSQ